MDSLYSLHHWYMEFEPNRAICKPLHPELLSLCTSQEAPQTCLIIQLENCDLHQC